MINKKLLEEILKIQKKKKKDIITSLNISYDCLKHKLDGKYEFKLSEVQKICQILEINSLGLKDEIFFMHNVNK
ncbi:MAG: toxin-antitoxin system, antitoxin component, Xre family protein [Elusimicrobiota bacterium]|jgi:DNA-binding Xre family transcriptional regulator|nr:toxin-antitoxin system, antitoxin component, Xre family protein [Elusimicrobiota bacterium]